MDRGLYFAKVTPERSYAMAFDMPGLKPTAMYVSVDGPKRSVRTTPTTAGEKLLIGGSGHVVGRTASTQNHVDDLVHWTLQHYSGARITYVWSAQDYAPHDHLPSVGKLPRGGGHTYFAIGYGKWGMKNGVAAALRISASILGGQQPWAAMAGHRITNPIVGTSGELANARTGIAMTAGWAGAYIPDSAFDAVAERGGAVGRDGSKPTVISTIDGVTCKLSAVFSHLGGIVAWNDADSSWDCPLHGSGFAADGPYWKARQQNRSHRSTKSRGVRRRATCHRAIHATMGAATSRWTSIRRTPPHRPVWD